MHLYICASVSISLWLNRSSMYDLSGVELSVALIYRKHEPCVHLWIRQFISASWIGCWDGSRRVIILVTTSARSRFPGLSNHLCIAHLFGFLALDAIASLREHTIIFLLYFRSQIPRVAHRCALELIFGSAARFSAPGWIFPHPSETSGKPTYH